jgi:hypothetical protein
MFSSTNPLEVEAKLNLDLHALDNLAKQWLVDFNPQKTEYMVISFRQNWHQQISSAISFIKNKNNNGPKTEHCGRLLSMFQVWKSLNCLIKLVVSFLR